MNPSRMQDEAGITTQAARFATDRSVSFPSAALNFARLSFYDIFAVALAGQDEPASRIVRELVVREGGTPQASAFGMETRIPPRAAALLNGTVAHALDYDDTHFAFVGHPSVAVLPAALAVAEQQQADGNAVLEAFLCGVEATCRIGQWLGRAHYNAGFHQTATSGAFGATAACSRLLGLDVTQATHAFGLAATRASGLKCQFGSMGKPFHAGMAAANGVEAATLASLGFESRRDAIEGTGGFASTHGAQTAHGSDPFGGLPQHFRFVDVQYKFHACCHGTHPGPGGAARAAHQTRPSDRGYRPGQAAHQSAVAARLLHCATANRTRSQVQSGVHCRDGAQRTGHGSARRVFGFDVRRPGARQPHAARIDPR